MRQALNNLQSTCSGFGIVNADNVFKVCDQPHPLIVKAFLEACVEPDLDKALGLMQQLWNLGYSAQDIIVTVFRVAKTATMAEYLKLEFIKVQYARRDALPL